MNVGDRVKFTQAYLQRKHRLDCSEMRGTVTRTHTVFGQRLVEVAWDDSDTYDIGVEYVELAAKEGGNDG